MRRWRAAKPEEPVAPELADDEEGRPTYLRGWFVTAVVVVALLLAALTFRVATTDPPADVEAGASADTDVDVEAEATPQSTNPDDCPEPGMSIPFEAAELLTLLQTAAADPDVGDIPATDEVQDQLDAAEPSPALTRMTPCGFAGDSSTVSTCVISYWSSATGEMQSLDIVTVAAVPGDERSDRDGRDGDLPDRWEVIRWLRGVPQPQARTRAVPLAYFNGNGCSRPDRMVSVPVPDGNPNERLRSALEELISGTAGRSMTASSSVPADLRCSRPRSRDAPCASR
ncbi:MAG: hypothetical protein R2716_02615 [Microthrixaceae bacterium]